MSVVLHVEKMSPQWQKDAWAKYSENSGKIVFILEEVGPVPDAVSVADIPSFPAFDPFHFINKRPKNHRTSCKFHSVFHTHTHCGLLQLRPIAHLSREPQRTMSFPLGQILVQRDGWEAQLLSSGCRVDASHFKRHRTAQREGPKGRGCLVCVRPTGLLLGPKDSRRRKGIIEETLGRSSCCEWRFRASGPRKPHPVI